MKAIITGATGAVGMALIGELLARGDDVVVLCRPNSKRNSRIPAHPAVRRVDCALDSLCSLDLGEERFDAFFHLGWEGTTGAARNDMQLQTRNIKHTADAVELAARLGCSVFVGAGSQAEYGRVSGKLNSATPAFPENCYGMAKLAAGQMSRVACRQKGMRHIWVRILSVYGEYDGENSLVTSTIRKLLDGEHCSFTAGEQIWDYMYSGDAAKAMVELARDGIDGGIYCLGSGKTRQLREYIEIMRDKVAPDACLGFGDIPYAEGQVMYLCADTSELIRDTGFEPCVSFEDGIDRTIEWYKKERKTV